MAFNGLEYATPATAAGKDVVVTLSGCGEEEPAVTTTAAVPDLVVSAALVAVTVTFVLTVTVGAWYRPETEIVPSDADQVTAVFELPATEALNCWVPADWTVAVAGETVTTTPGGLDDEFAGTETPEQAAKKRREDAKATRIAHCRKLGHKFARYERRRFVAGGSARYNIQPPLEQGFGRTLNT